MILTCLVIGRWRWILEHHNEHAQIDTDLNISVSKRKTTKCWTGLFWSGTNRASGLFSGFFFFSRYRRWTFPQTLRTELIDCILLNFIKHAHVCVDTDVKKREGAASCRSASSSASLSVSERVCRFRCFTQNQEVSASVCFTGDLKRQSALSFLSFLLFTVDARWLYYAAVWVGRSGL